MTLCSISLEKSKSFLTPFVAVLLFVPLFIFRGIGGFDFWWWMSLNVAAVVSFAFLTDKSCLNQILEDMKKGLGKKIGLGLLSAIVLYSVFFAGNGFSRLIFPSAGNDISQVYSFKESASLLRIVLLVTVLIGPGEELFWRGQLQRLWEKNFGKFGGYILAAVLYALVHAASGNVMLVLAAGICGLFWGFLYMRFRSVLLIGISHTVWDLMILVVWPLGE